MKLLARERWAAGVDCVGGTVLANVLSMTRADGAIAACGNAAGMELPTSVAPFILRGVALLGINSVTVPKPLRIAAWDRLARDIDRGKLAAMTTTMASTTSCRPRTTSSRARCAAGWWSISIN